MVLSPSEPTVIAGEGSVPKKDGCKKSAFPAKAGIHFSTAPASAKWIPAFAGNADF